MIIGFWEIAYWVSVVRHIEELSLSPSILGPFGDLGGSKSLNPIPRRPSSQAVPVEIEFQIDGLGRYIICWRKSTLHILIPYRLIFKYSRNLLPFQNLDFWHSRTKNFISEISKRYTKNMTSFFKIQTSL